jgi:hypothetical protein
MEGKTTTFSHRMYTGVSDVRRTEIHIAERLVPEPSTFKVKTVTANFKRYRSQGADKISAEMSQA